MTGVTHEFKSSHWSSAQSAERVWQILSDVRDPELQVVSVVELGMIADVTINEMGSVHVGLKPSYLGCPALRYIEESIIRALNSAGIPSAVVHRVLSPGWSPLDISEAGAEKLRAEGIHISSPSTVPAQKHPREQSLAPKCPACGSDNLIITSSFGASPCLQMARCEVCGEPQAVFRCR